MADVPGGCGVEDRERGLPSAVTDPRVVDGVMSMGISSSGADEAPACRKGGGVRQRSSKEFQNSTPPELRLACLLKLFGGGLDFEGVASGASGASIGSDG